MTTMIQRCSVILLLCGMSLVPLDAFAADDAAGSITMLTGKATIATPDGVIRDAARGDAITAGEIVITAPNSYVNLTFSDGGRIVLRPNSRFEIESYQYDASADEDAPQPESNARFNLLKGGFRAVTGAIGDKNREGFEVKTPVATMGIRGTDFEGRLCAGDCLDISPQPSDGLYVAVNDGAIAMTNEAGETVSAAGQFAFIAGDDAAASVLPFKPRALSQDPIPDPADCD